MKKLSENRVTQSREKSGRSGTSCIFITRIVRLGRLRCGRRASANGSFWDRPCKNGFAVEGSLLLGGAPVAGRFLLRLDCCDQRPDPEYGDQPFEVVGQNAGAGLGSDVFQRFHLEVRRAHPGLQRAKRMFHGLSADTYDLWRTIGASLHRLDDRCMFPSLDPALLASRWCNFTSGNSLTLGT